MVKKGDVVVVRPDVREEDKLVQPVVKKVDVFVERFGLGEVVTGTEEVIVNKETGESLDVKGVLLLVLNKLEKIEQ